MDIAHVFSLCALQILFFSYFIRCWAREGEKSSNSAVIDHSSCVRRVAYCPKGAEPTTDETDGSFPRLTPASPVPFAIAPVDILRSVDPSNHKNLFLLACSAFSSCPFPLVAHWPVHCTVRSRSTATQQQPGRERVHSTKKKQENRSPDDDDDVKKKKKRG